MLTKKLLTTFGIVMMIAGFFSVLTALFYEFKVKPEVARRGHLASSQAAVSTKPAKDVHAKPQGIGIDALMNHSKGLYGSDETVRREGTLWVDQEGKKLVVNLGALNGLKAGEGLSVYDHDLQAGRVRVVDVFDVVAYVEADGSLEGPMDKSYYRVVKE